MDSRPRSTEALKREVSADGGGSLLSIMGGLWPYIWPAELPDLQLRVAVSMLLLLAAKLATIAVPFTFKWATDALTGEGTAPAAPPPWLRWGFAGAKRGTIAVPFTLKWGTDALTGEGTAPVAPSSWLLWVFAAPVAMTIAYG